MKYGFMMAVGLVALACNISPVAQADTTEDARAILSKHQDAVVAVKLVIKSAMAFGGRNTTKNEAKSEVTGTVIRPSGLTVISLSATDPAGIMQKLFKGDDGEEGQMKWESELGNVKIVHPNGKELAARVLLRDTDLDLVFIEPTEKVEEPFQYIDLTDSVPAQVLDEILVVNRLGTVAGRSPSATLGRVSARVDKPRTFYAINEASAVGLGIPVFNLSGKVVGLVFLRSIETAGGFSFESMFSGASNLGIMPIIVPASDILQSAEQIAAATAAPAEPAENKAEEKEPAPTEPKP